MAPTTSVRRQKTASHRAAPMTSTSKKLAHSPSARRKVKKVMHEYKEGQLHSRSKQGPKVKSRKQAIAIALHEAGVSRDQLGSKKKTSSKKASRKKKAR